MNIKKALNEKIPYNVYGQTLILTKTTKIELTIFAVVLDGKSNIHYYYIETLFGTHNDA
jgi:hypothetical protein